MKRNIYITVIFLLVFTFGYSLFSKSGSPDNDTENSKNIPGLTETKEKKCSFCHNDRIDYKNLHAPLPDDCEMCHTSTGRKHPSARYKGFSLAAEGSELCFTCHETIESKGAHQPIKKDKCSSCHHPHGSQYSKLLLNPPEKLCASCHDMKFTEKSKVHPIIELDGCQTCHDPHRSDFDNLLKIEQSEMCQTCHDISEQKEAEYQHAPFEFDCSECHDPHASPNEKLLHKSSPDLCLSCHFDIEENLKKKKNKHLVADKSLQCEKCHSPHASNHRSILKNKPSELCLDCHDKEIETKDKRIENIKETIDKSKHKHFPLKNEGCQLCHDPHASDHTALLKGQFSQKEYTDSEPENFDLCFTCHNAELLNKSATPEITNFRNGDTNLHYVHINGDKGRNCKLCHDAHAANNPFLIKSKTKFGNWDMPIEFEFSKTGGSCKTGCHEEKKYERITGDKKKPDEEIKRE